MGTGASKAKREAKKQAADAYYKALREAKRAERLGRVDTQGRRKISDQMGDDMSYQSKRLAQKADKVGREINAQEEEFNAGVDKYNDRYDKLQRQMASPTGVSKGVNYAKDLEPGMREEFSRIDAEIDSLLAQEAEFQKSRPRQPFVYGRAQGGAALTEEQRTRAARISELQQERDSIDRSSRGINNSYRNLGNLESAFNELAVLSKEAQGYTGGRRQIKSTDDSLRDMLSQQDSAPAGGVMSQSRSGIMAGSPQPTMGNALGELQAFQASRKPFAPESMKVDPNAAGSLIPKFAQQYETIGLKLKQSLERDQRMAMPKQKPGGLLSSELMSGDGQVEKEVIG